MNNLIRFVGTNAIFGFIAVALVLAGKWKGQVTAGEVHRLFLFVAGAAIFGAAFGHALLILKNALAAAWGRCQVLGVPSEPELLLRSAQAIVRAGGGGPYGFDATVKFNQISAFNMILESQRQIRRLEAVGVLPPLELSAFHDGGEASHLKREQI